MKATMKALVLRNPAFRRHCAIVCLALFLFLQLFAASGPLHQAIHSDAGTPGHQCVITLLAHGQINSPNFSQALVTFVAVLFALLPTLHSVFISSFAYRLSHSRAPPRF